MRIFNESILFFVGIVIGIVATAVISMTFWSSRAQNTPPLQQVLSPTLPGISTPSLSRNQESTSSVASRLAQTTTVEHLVGIASSALAADTGVDFESKSQSNDVQQIGSFEIGARYLYQAFPTYGQLYYNPVELLLTDPLNRRLGYADSRRDLFEIPYGSYYREAGGVYLLDPSATAGVYQLKAIGLKLGTYILGPNLEKPIYGLTDSGSEDDYTVTLTNTPPTAAIKKLATVTSSLQDVNTAMKLGLIDTQETADALSLLLGEVTQASSSAETELLSMFREKTTAKEIRGLASQVLLRDADSLIEQQSNSNQ